MNTKIFIISIALILMFPQSVSIGASFQKQLFTTQNIHNTIAPANNKHNNGSMDWTFDWSYDDSVHHHNQSDDDNKSHHFHYERFTKKRNRVLLSILLKIVLLITHLSSLICASVHLLH